MKAKLLEGKKGLVVGMANKNSIAWGRAKAFQALGADLAVTYLNDKAKKFVEPLAKALDARIVMPLDVNTAGQMEAVFKQIEKEWGKLVSSSTLYCVLAEGCIARTSGGRISGRLCNHNGCIVLDIHSFAWRISPNRLCTKAARFSQ